MKTNFITKTRDLIQREKKPSFLKEVDLFDVDDSVIIGASGSIGKGYRLEGKDLLLEKNSEIHDFENRMRRFLNSLPEKVALHFVVRQREGDEVLLHDYLKSIQTDSPISERFAQARIETHMKHPFIKRDVYLFVVTHPAGKKPRNSLVPDIAIAFNKKAVRLEEAEFHKISDQLEVVTSEIEESLKDLGITLSTLNDDEVIEYCYQLLNPSDEENGLKGAFRLSGCIEDPSTLRSKLLLSVPYAGYDAFYLNKYFHQAINLSELPDSTDLKSMKAFEGALGKEYYLTVTLEVPDQEREKSGLRRSGNLSRAESFYSRTKNHEALAKEGATDALLTEIAESSDKLFYFSLSVIVRSPDKAESDRIARNALRGFRYLGDGARAILDHMNHDRLFLSLLPLQGGENPLAFLVSSETAVNLLPLQSSWPGTEKIGLLLKTYRNAPLKLDLFDSSLASKHALMLGSTGSGKSFFTNHLLMHFLSEAENHDVIVLDLGGSYRKLANILGGSYLEVECSEEFALNPFPSKEVLFPEEGEADATFLQFLKELLQKMIDPERVWSASEKVILERVIRFVYKNLSPKEAPLLGDVQKYLLSYGAGDEEDRMLAYKFAKELTLFCEGEYSKILNRPARFDFDSRFAVFDLRKISQYEELQEILLLIIPFALRRKFENVSRKKILVLDECWHLLKKTQGVDLIELFFRTMRKMNGAVLAVSQNPEDYLGSEIAGVMANNAHVKYILRLKKGYEELALLGFNENQIKAVRELEVRPGRYSEVFILFDQKSVLAKLEPSPFEYWIATTDPTDLAEEKRIQAEFNEDCLLLIERLASEYPNGVKKSGVAS